MTKLPRKVKNLLLAAVAALAGLASVIIIFTALLLGLWADAQQGGGRVFTVLSLMLSVPVSLATMLLITLVAVRRIIPQTPPRKTTQAVPQEEESV